MLVFSSGSFRKVARLACFDLSQLRQCYQLFLQPDRHKNVGVGRKIKTMPRIQNFKIKNLLSIKKIGRL